MNLYTASIRVCFLLFESMRGHLKFQLEVCEHWRKYKSYFSIDHRELSVIKQVWFCVKKRIRFVSCRFI